MKAKIKLVLLFILIPFHTVLSDDLTLSYIPDQARMQEARLLNSTAGEYYAAGDYETAAKIYIEAIKTESSFIYPHYNLACVLSLQYAQGLDVNLEEIRDELLICLGLDATREGLSKNWLHLMLDLDSDFDSVRIFPWFVNLQQSSKFYFRIDFSFNQLENAIFAEEILLFSQLMDTYNRKNYVTSQSQSLWNNMLELASESSTNVMYRFLIGAAEIDEEFQNSQQNIDFQYSTEVYERILKGNLSHSTPLSLDFSGRVFSILAYNENYYAIYKLETEFWMYNMTHYEVTIYDMNTHRQVQKITKSLDMGWGDASSSANEIFEYYTPEMLQDDEQSILEILKLYDLDLLTQEVELKPLPAEIDGNMISTTTEDSMFWLIIDGERERNLNDIFISSGNGPANYHIFGYFDFPNINTNNILIFWGIDPLDYPRMKRESFTILETDLIE